MSDARIRLLSREGGATELERSVLRSGLDVDPPPDAKAEVWAALATRLPPAGPGPGAETAVAGSAAGAWKAGAIGAAIGLLVAGGAFLSEPQDAPQQPQPAVAALPTRAAPRAPGAAPERTAPVEPAAPAAPAARPVARQMAPATPAAPPAEAAPAVAAPEPAEEPTPAEARQSQLREESRLVREARAALRAGNAGGALALLDELRKKYPRPVLGQEQEALAIEALHASGSRAAARDRARAFIARFPTSPLASKLKTIAESH